MTAKEKLLQRAPDWTEREAEIALRAVEGEASEVVAEREREIGRQIVEGYKRIPPGGVDEWGDLDAQTDAATAAVMQDLDEEERAEFGETIGEAWGRKKRE